MPFIATAITSMCLGIASSGQYNTACNKAAEAGTKQLGTYQVLEDGERKTMEFAAKQGEYKLGGTVMKAGAAGVYVYRTYRDKSLTFKVKDIGVADSMTNQVTPNSYKVSFNWHF